MAEKPILTLRVDPGTLLKLDAKATETGLTRSKAAAALLEAALGDGEAPEKDRAPENVYVPPEPEAIAASNGAAKPEPPDRDAWIADRARKLYGGQGYPKAAARRMAEREYEAEHGG